ncbi:MAG: bifunctional riboflavin kinase/FAD synthetase [Bacteroidetes bacterium]|nr:bifunctional riboflavin kinase/FAD synthetase [Bacteroidota bacterium]
MLTVRNTRHFRLEKPTILTIGTFDGVHLGHQKILSRLQQLKKQFGLNTVVLTFEPHPRKILFPEQTDLKLLTLIDEKLNLLETYGVDVTVVYPFDKEFSNIESKEYIEDILLKSLKVKYLVIGYDHKFGRNRSGDINVLKQFSGSSGFQVEEINALDIDSISISSSKIRQALELGNIELANNYLGHTFFLYATVIKGKQLGRTIGYPTANLKIESCDKLIPKIGVYFVEVIVDSLSYFGMMSIGYNPTTDNDNEIKLEVHLFEFNKDLYGKTIRVNFIKYLRDEMKFNSLDELTKELQEDKKKCILLIDQIKNTVKTVKSII